MKAENSMQSMSDDIFLSNRCIESSYLPNFKSRVAEIQTWLVSYIAKDLEIESQQIDVNAPFSRYGLDSSAMIMITADLGDWLGQQLEPTVSYNHPTIEALSRYLAIKEAVVPKSRSNTSQLS